MVVNEFNEHIGLYTGAAVCVSMSWWFFLVESQNDFSRWFYSLVAMHWLSYTHLRPTVVSTLLWFIPKLLGNICVKAFQIVTIVFVVVVAVVDENLIDMEKGINCCLSSKCHSLWKNVWQITTFRLIFWRMTWGVSCSSIHAPDGTAGIRNESLAHGRAHGWSCVCKYLHEWIGSNLRQK